MYNNNNYLYYIILLFFIDFLAVFPHIYQDKRKIFFKNYLHTIFIEFLDQNFDHLFYPNNCLRKIKNKKKKLINIFVHSIFKIKV